MASVALDPSYRRVEVHEFLAMDFGDAKAELEDGLIYMMAGGTPEHARVAARLIRHLGNALEGSGCEPVGSDQGLQTAEQTVRYPDISIYCGEARTASSGGTMLIGEPVVIIEVLSPSTGAKDQKVKLPEYQALSGVRDILFIDPTRRWTRVISRTASGWADDTVGSGKPIPFASLGLQLSPDSIFDPA